MTQYIKDALPTSEINQLGTIALLWRHNEHEGVSNHQPHDGLFNRLFKAQIK